MAKTISSKYGNEITYQNGQKYHSKGEANRGAELEIMEKAGLISGLRRQVEYLLIPAQYRIVNGKRKCIERKCTYTADFVYWQNGELVVEDFKGFRTKDYKIKKKLMLERYDIQIKEVSNGNRNRSFNSGTNRKYNVQHLSAKHSAR